jgi:hypothetical protein
MATIFWTLGYATLITLILLRIPKLKATSTNIDKNPKILDVLIQAMIGIYLVSNAYLNVYV